MSADRLDLLGFVPFRFNRLAVEFSAALAADYRRYGLDIPDWRVLATLGMQPEPRTASYVVRCTRTHKSRISRAVSRLVELGFLERTEDADNRREVMLRLTPRGREVYAELVPAVRAVEDRLLSGLSPQQRDDLSELLTAVERALGLVHRDGGG